MKKTFIVILTLLVQLPTLAQSTANNPWFYPNPSGEHKVGTFKWTLEDCSRTEELSADKGCRQFTVRAWYPATNTSGRSQLGFLEGYDFEKLAPFFGMHGVLVEKFKQEAHQVKTPAYKDANVIRKKRLPVIILSHGFGLSLPELHTSIAIEAASHGYLVFGINHTFESMANQLDDQTVYLDVPYYQKQTTTVFTKGAKLATLPGLPDDMARKKLMKEVLGALDEMNARLKEWVKDQRYLLDQLMAANKDKSSRWYRKIDPDRIGTLGHSFGGTTATQTLMLDNRVKAAVNLDGLQMGDLIDRDVNKPVLMVSSKVFQGLNDAVFEGSSGPVFLVHPGDKITYHNIYTDMVLWPDHYFSNRKQAIGEIEGQSFVKMNNELILSFFNQSFNKKQTDLSAVINAYDQLQLIDN